METVTKAGLEALSLYIVFWIIPLLSLTRGRALLETVLAYREAGPLGHVAVGVGVDVCGYVSVCLGMCGYVLVCFRVHLYLRVCSFNVNA